MKNLCSKTRKIYDPYEIWCTSDFEWKWFVLKKYKSPESEQKDRFARWLVAVTSPMVGNNPDIGDAYRDDIIHIGLQLLGYIYRNVHYCFECGEHLKRDETFFLHNKLEYPVINDMLCIYCHKPLADIQPTKKTVERLLEE